MHIHEVQTKVTQLQSMVELMVNLSHCNILKRSKKHLYDTVCKESKSIGHVNHIQLQLILPWFRVNNFILMFDSALFCHEFIFLIITQSWIKCNYSSFTVEFKNVMTFSDFFNNNFVQDRAIMTFYLKSNLIHNVVFKSI